MDETVMLIANECQSATKNFTSFLPKTPATLSKIQKELNDDTVINVNNIITFIRYFARFVETM